MNTLTPRQKKFCELYAMDPCGERAAVQAGYQNKSARQQASRLLTNANIINYIREIQEALSDTRILTATETKIFWSDVVRDETQKMSDRLQASAHLAKSGGFFLTAIEMDIHNEKRKTTLICLPAIPGKDTPRREGSLWIYGEDEAEAVHSICKGGDYRQD